MAMSYSASPDETALRGVLHSLSSKYSQVRALWATNLPRGKGAIFPYYRLVGRPPMPPGGECATTPCARPMYLCLPVVGEGDEGPTACSRTRDAYKGTSPRGVPAAGNVGDQEGKYHYRLSVVGPRSKLRVPWYASNLLQVKDQRGNVTYRRCVYSDFCRAQANFRICTAIRFCRNLQANGHGRFARLTRLIGEVLCRLLSTRTEVCTRCRRRMCVVGGVLRRKRKDYQVGHCYQLRPYFTGLLRRTIRVQADLMVRVRSVNSRDLRLQGGLLQLCGRRVRVRELLQRFYRVLRCQRSREGVESGRAIRSISVCPLHLAFIGRFGISYRVAGVNERGEEKCS